MNFMALASSSAGNAYIVDDGQTKLLVECGIPYRRLQKLTGFGMAGIAGCLLSHEHKDHAKCYLDLLKNGIPVYASKGTARMLECDLFTILEAQEEISVGTMDIKTFPVFHDAAEPFGYLIRSRKDGEKLLFATDTVNLRYEIPGLHHIAIECNYTEELLLQSAKLPDKVKHRIRNSHMELERVCDYLAHMDLSVCRQVYLMHLSDACSREDLFIHRVGQVCKGVPVTVCPKQKG